MDGLQHAQAEPIDPVLTLLGRRDAAIKVHDRLQRRLDEGRFNPGLTPEVCEAKAKAALDMALDTERQIARTPALTTDGAFAQAHEAMIQLRDDMPDLIPLQMLEMALPVIEHSVTGKGVKPRDWRPEGLRGVCVSHINPDNPITLMMQGDGDGYWRDPTDGEWRGFLLENPYSAEDCRPNKLRELLPDYDGELFALFAELHQLADEWWDHEAHDWKPGADERRAEILRQICVTPAVTDVGNAMKLELVMRTEWPGTAAMPHAEKRALMGSVFRWLVANLHHRGVPMERRCLDVEKEAQGLRSYFEREKQSPPATAAAE